MSSIAPAMLSLAICVAVGDGNDCRLWRFFGDLRLVFGNGSHHVEGGHAANAAVWLFR